MSIGTVFSSLIAIVLSLAFVLALAWGGLVLLRKFQDGGFGRLDPRAEGRTLRFERALPVGPRERIVLIEVDGEQMLLGVTAHAITQLKTWPAEDKPAPKDSAEEVARTEREAERPRFRLPMAGRQEG